MKVLGFTGTRYGMTVPQRCSIYSWIEQFTVKVGGEFHHGDCVGADVDAADMARKQGLTIVGHPSTIESKRGYFESDETLDPLPAIDRNHVIVDSSDVIIAAPATEEERQRSGTWATIRYAKSIGRTVLIAYPGGRVETFKG